MALYFDGQTTLDSEQYDAIAYYRLSKDDVQSVKVTVLRISAS